MIGGGGLRGVRPVGRGVERRGRDRDNVLYEKRGFVPFCALSGR